MITDKNLKRKDFKCKSGQASHTIKEVHETPKQEHNDS